MGERKIKYRSNSFSFKAKRKIGYLAIGSLLLSACGSTAAAATTNTKSSLPSGFPTSWKQYGGNSLHNAAFPNSSNSKAYSWNFAEASALPLTAPAKDQSVLGAKNAPVKTTQDLGNSVGVSAVNGIIYSESDMGYIYALNAATGKQIWRAHGNNAFMGNPVVAHGVVVAGSGDTGFSFTQVLNMLHKKPMVRGLGWASIYGFNAKTGKKMWSVPTKGEDMASLAEKNGVVYEGTGGGHIIAINITSGKVLWKTTVGGFDSMSSAAVSGNTVVLGFTNPNYLIAVNAKTGAVIWKQTVAGIANTGIGDNSPSIDAAKGLVFQDSVVNANPKTKTMNLEVFATNLKTGKLVWQQKLGRGPVPPAYKAGITMVHNGTVYVGTPNLSTFFALNETTGAIKWSYKILGAGPAGAGRGGATFYHGIVWLAAGKNIYALNPTNGSLLGKYVGGGRYGIVNPVIVGATMYLGNSWGWTQAIPLSKIYPNWKNTP